MKLLSHLKKIILEASDDKILVDNFIYNDKEILLSATFHQWNDRFGIKSFEEILDIYENNKDPKLRIGVPNEMIKFLFQKNFEKINKKFNETKPSPNFKLPRLLIVKNRKEENEENENPEFFDFAEFIIQKNSQYRFDIITSAFSKDGLFLRHVGKTPNNTPRLTVERKFYFDYTLII